MFHQVAVLYLLRYFSIFYLERSQTDTVTGTIGKHTHTSDPREPQKDAVSEAYDIVWVPSMGTGMGAVGLGPKDAGPRVSQLCSANTGLLAVLSIKGLSRGCALLHGAHCNSLCPSPGPFFAPGGQPAPPGPSASQTKSQNLDPFADLGDLSSTLQGTVQDMSGM